MSRAAVPQVLDNSFPGWLDYRELIQQLNLAHVADGDFPPPHELQKLLPGDAINGAGLPIRFRPSAELPDVAYEEHIYCTGEVSTRNNWHDLFNALVWMRFGRIKAAMNAAHFEQITQQQGPARGPRRDALTLFDECGVIVATDNEDLLTSLAARNWQQALCEQASAWAANTYVFVSGHAMLEKSLQPYKAMTAQALLLQLDRSTAGLSRAELLPQLDRVLANEILRGELLQNSRDLSPLPLCGIPGWWAMPQNQAFYSDLQVFRPPAAGLTPAPIREFMRQPASTSD